MSSTYTNHRPLFRSGKIREELLQRRNPTHSAPAVSHSRFSDEEGSIVRTAGKNFSCGACRTKETTKWWKAPRGLSSSVLCDNCGTSWRKYADLNPLRPVREEAMAAKAKTTAEKREGTPLSAPANKRLKATGSVRSSPAPVAPSMPQMRCVACHKNGPAGKVVKCQQCQMKIHAGLLSLIIIILTLGLQHSNAHVGACGFVSDPSTSEWYCDLCQNEKVAEASLVCIIRRLIYSSFIEDFFLPHRTPTACFVLVLSGTERAKNTIHYRTPSSAHVNQRKDKDGPMSSVLSSIPK